MDDPLSLTPEALLALPLPAAEAALRAWVKAGRAALPVAVAAGPSKDHARLAKKALYQLRSSGVPVPEPAAPAAAAPVAPPAAEAGFPGILSPLLGTGERAVLFARPVRGGGLTVYQGVLSDEEGVLQLVATPSTRAEYRQRLAELEAEPVVKTVVVGWERLRRELGRALWLTDRATTPPGAQVMDLLRVLDLTPEDPEAEPLPPPGDGDERLAARAAGLRQERELSSWLPSEPALQELGKALVELDASPLALSPAQRAQRVRQVVEKVASGYLTPARRRRYARRLWATAELLEASGRPEPASVARAEARRLFHLEAASAFVEAMFQAAADLRPPPRPEAPAAAPGGAPEPKKLILP